MQMLRYYIMLVFVVVFAGCNANPETRLKGKWVNKALKKGERGTLYIEFFAKGNATIKMQMKSGDLTIWGDMITTTYEIIDKNTIKFTGPLGFSGINEFVIKGNKLMLTRPGDKTEVFTKEDINAVTTQD